MRVDFADRQVKPEKRRQNPAVGVKQVFAELKDIFLSMGVAEKSVLATARLREDLGITPARYEDLLQKMQYKFCVSWSVANLQPIKTVNGLVELVRTSKGWGIAANEMSYMYSEKCGCEGGTVRPIGGHSHPCTQCRGLGIRKVEHLSVETWKKRTGYTEVVPKRCRSCPSWDRTDKRKKKTCLVLREVAGSLKEVQTAADGTCEYHGKKGIEHVAMRKKAREFLKTNGVLK